MRNVIKSLPYPAIRWLLFNLACLDRVFDLFDDPRYTDYLRLLGAFAADPNRDQFRSFSREEAKVREADRQLYLRRKEPLYPARAAAARAIGALTPGTLGTSEMVAVAVGRRVDRRHEAYQEELRAHCDLLRDIFGNPFFPVVFDPRWRSESAVALARTAYETRNFTLLPILADALEEAGCDHADVLTHCRDPKQVHVRGCWVVDGVLGKV